MESLQDILGSRQFKQPDEMQAIKNYIKKRYKSDCKITQQKTHLIVGVNGSALAASIQLERQQLIEACGLTQKIFIRVER